MGKRLPFLIGLAAWWLLVPFEHHFTTDNGELLSAALPTLVLFGFVLTICIVFRHRPSVVGSWIPLCAFSAWILYQITSAINGEMSAPGGGGEPAPLEGVAMLIGAATWGLALLIFVGCLFIFPRKFHPALFSLSVINCAAVAFAIHTSTDAIGRQIITVTIRDQEDKPILGAEVKWRVFGYGPRGTRPAWPEITGGPVLTDNEGVVYIRSKAIRHEVLLDVTKTGYLHISAELGMQFDKYWENRNLRIHVGKVLNVAYGDIPSRDPVGLTLYLPPSSDAPQPLRYKQVGFHLSPSSPYRYFSFASGFVRADPADGDLQFDFVDDPNSRWPKLKISALHGGGVVQRPFKFAPNNGVTSYEQQMHKAPSSGYQESTILDNYNLPGPIFYFRNTDGTLYARFDIDGAPNKNGDGGVILTTWVNPTGSRLLIFDPALTIK